MNNANKITIIRILLIPVFMFFALSSHIYFDLIACAIFVIAAATDGLDGYVARKYNVVTNFGKFVDPLADKLLITAALVCLVELAKIGPVVTIIIISREFVVTSLRIVAISEGKVIAASFWGKLKTTSQIVAITSIFLANYIFLGVRWLPNVLIYIAAAITVISGFDYVIRNYSLIDSNK